MGYHYKDSFLTNINITLFFNKIEHKIYLEKFEKLKEKWNSFSELKEYVHRDYQIKSNETSDEIHATFEPATLVKNEYQQISIENGLITIDFNGKKYQSFENNILPIILEIKTILQIFDIRECCFMGLKYINEIIRNDLDLNNIVSKDFHHFYDKKNIIRSMIHEEYKENNSIVTINYGQFNNNYPNPNVENYYIIDIQAHTDISYTIGEFEQIIHELHNLISEYFENMITNHFREIMDDNYDTNDC